MNHFSASGMHTSDIIIKCLKGEEKKKERKKSKKKEEKDEHYLLILI